MDEKKDSAEARWEPVAFWKCISDEVVEKLCSGYIIYFHTIVCVYVIFVIEWFIANNLFEPLHFVLTQIPVIFYLITFKQHVFID